MSVIKYIKINYIKINIFEIILSKLILYTNIYSVKKRKMAPH